jgi:protein SCO1/2
MLAPGVLGGLLLLAAGARTGADASRLAVIQPAPAFTLNDQAGHPVSRDGLRGKAWLVSFVFTTCTGSCPETTLRMSLIQRELKRRGLLNGGDVRLVSITLDPERDRPEVLRDYMRTYDADPAVWSFLTGPPPRVREVIGAWGMWARRLPGGQLDHPSRIFLVDRRGRVREIYNLAFLRPAWVAEDIELLLREPPVRTPSPAASPPGT